MGDHHFPPRRTELGPVFSEGARQLWMYLRRERLTVRQLAALIGKPQPTIWRLLHGERRASREIAATIAKLGIAEVSAWDLPPARAFHLPAA